MYFPKCQTIYSFKNLVGILDSTPNWFSVGLVKLKQRKGAHFVGEKKPGDFEGQIEGAEIADEERDDGAVKGMETWIGLAWRARECTRLGRDWKQRQLKENKLTHNNVFVENPVFESKQCLIFQLSLSDKDRGRWNRKTALEKQDKRNPKYAITRPVKEN